MDMAGKTRATPKKHPTAPANGISVNGYEPGVDGKSTSELDKYVGAAINRAACDETAPIQQENIYKARVSVVQKGDVQ